jgi:ribonucleotide reductase alpha subunit
MDQFFRSKFSEDIFNHKYRHDGCETWDKLADILVEDVCRDKLSKSDKQQLKRFITEMKFIPGGRYLYYAGRPFKAFNNCYLLKSEEDSREDWASLSWKAESALMTGGGIGNDYSIYRPKNSVINKTGGLASGPVSKMRMINEIGREVMQGGSRRSAIYASLNWKHADILEFIHAKDWYNMKVAGIDQSIGHLKELDFNFPAPLDMTNISVNYDTEWLEKVRKTGDLGNVFLDNVKQALKTSEPGFSFNFYENENETLRNAPVSANTYVLTSEGYLTIRETLGKDIELWTGKRWAKTQFVKTKSNVETLKVFITGGRSIEADYDHEFLVERYEGKGKKRKLASIDRVKARNLRIGDVLNVSLPDSRKEEFDASSYTLGYMYGDGTFRKDGPGGEITLCTQQSKDCLNHMDTTMFSSVNDGYRDNYTRVYVSAKSLPKGRKKDIFPYIEANQSFIAGLFDSDGSYDPDQHRIRVNSIHRGFLEGLRRKLEEYGILSGITTAGISTFGQSQGYALVIMGTYVSKFAELISPKRLNINNFVPYRDSKLKVKDIQLGGIQDVYCCDVKVEEHSFMAEGIIISNCTEVTSEDDSDVCNLGSLNMANIDSLDEFDTVIDLATKFLLCGTLIADLPYEKVYKVREKNRRLGLGLMGVHEWLLKRGYKYEVNAEMHEWLSLYKNRSNYTARKFSDRLSISRPVAVRAIAPTGSIGILAGTSTGIEPLFAVAYKRRYLKGRHQWVYQYVVDSTAKIIIDLYDVDPQSIETAVDLASDYERRIKFQADIQDYVDMSISSTINLPAWGTELNNESTVVPFAKTLAKYAHRLRGFTCYADGSRGGQPITPVDYREARQNEGQEYEERFFDVCEIGKGGICGS